MKFERLITVINNDAECNVFIIIAYPNPCKVNLLYELLQICTSMVPASVSRLTSIISSLFSSNIPCKECMEDIKTWNCFRRISNLCSNCSDFSCK